MKPIFRLIEDRLAMLFKSLLRNFLTAVCWQAVQHKDIGRRFAHQLLVDLKRRKFLEAQRALLLESHADPYVGVKNVDKLRSRKRVVRDNDLSVGQSLQKRFL